MGVIVNPWIIIKYFSYVQFTKLSSLLTSHPQLQMLVLIIQKYARSGIYTFMGEAVRGLITRMPAGFSDKHL